MLNHAIAKFKPHSQNSGTLAIAQVDSGNSIGMQFTNGSGTADWDIALQPFGGRVGIGKVDPNYTLDVAGTGRFTNILYNTSTSENAIKTRFIAGAASGATTDGTLYLQYGKTNPVSIGETSTGGLHVAGNVGIGTTSPSAKLHVSGTSDVLLVEGSGSTILDIQGSQGQLFSVTDSLVGSLFSVNDISGLPIIEVFDTDKVVMGTFGQNTLVVTGSRVGIGTTAPAQRLHVNGASIIADGNTAIDPDVSDYSVVAGAINDGGGWGVNSGIGGRAAGAGDTWAIGHNGGNLYFGIGNGTAANSLTTFLEVSPTRVLKFPQLTAGFLKTNASGVVSVDTTTGTVDTSTLEVSGYRYNNPAQGKWYQVGTYQYINPTIYYKYTKVANLTAASLIGALEYICKKDSNYAGAVRGTVHLATYNGSSMSVQHDQHGGDGDISPEVYIDNNRDVWLRMVNSAWNSHLRFRWIDIDGGITTYDGSTQQNSTIANSALVAPGQSVRFTWGNVTALTVYNSVSKAYNLSVETDITVGDQIIHRGDTDTYMQFHNANEWRVVTAGSERLEVGSNVKISNASFGTATTATSATSASFATFANSAGSSINATNALNIAVNDTDTNATFYPLFGDGTSGNVRAYVDASTFTYNASSDTLTVANLAGNATTATTATTASNAMLLDGLDSTLFVRSDSNDTLQGNYLFSRTNTSPAIDVSGHAGAASYNYFLRARNDEGNKVVMFVNGSTRTADGGVNAATIRNDGGFLILGSASHSTKLVGSGNLTYNGDAVLTTAAGTAVSATSASHAEFADTAGTAGSATTATTATNADNVNIDNTTTGTGYRVMFADSAGTGYERPYVHDNGIEYDPETGTLRLSGDVVAYNSFSDRELKDNIQTYEGGLNAVMQLNPVTYEWKKGREGQEIGLIAQEVEQVVPQVVREQQRMDEGTYKTVDYEKLVAVLIDAVQDQQRQINELKDKLNGLTE